MFNKINNINHINNILISDDNSVKYLGFRISYNFALLHPRWVSSRSVLREDC